MKLALIGDIHGNADALGAVLAAAEKMDVEHLLVTGDLVGYYFAPAKVLELLAIWSKHIVRGNHEEMLVAARAERTALEAISTRYGSGIQIALEQLTENQLDEICSFPHPLKLDIDGCRILLCHGAHWDVDQYVYPDAKPELLERCCNLDFDFVVMGHTHYPMIKQVDNMQIINPGSVGQPRNGQPGAQWAFLDTISRHLEFRIEEYDRSSLIKECEARHPELPYLAEVLKRT